MKKFLILIAAIGLATGQGFAAKAKTAVKSDREVWSELAYKIAKPILEPMSRGALQSEMKMTYSPIWDDRSADFAWMEAFGRLMAGIAPWLALPDDATPEGIMRSELRDWALKSYVHAVDPESPDYLGWKAPGYQTIVDASYLANSFIRAPKALWEPLDEVTKKRYVHEFKELRKIPCWHNNWILFRVMIEAFLMSVDEQYDAFAIRLGLEKIDEWYVGDGWYSDGDYFTMDNYNSYVISPMTVEVTELMKDKKVGSPISFDLALRRMQRYNVHLERMISPEGTYPTLGRSITYRMGAFQTLTLAAWRYGLPKNLTNGGVRSALTAVMKRMFANGRNFDKDGYLTLGFAGTQPGVADSYTNVGSVYITSLVFLPLGLPADAPFWTAPAEKWTSQKAWDGEPFPKDYHEAIKR